MAILGVVVTILATIGVIVLLVRSARTSAVRARDEYRKIGATEPLRYGGTYVSGHPQIVHSRRVTLSRSGGDVLILAYGHPLLLGRIRATSIQGLEVLDKTRYEQRIHTKSSVSLTRVALLGGVGLLFPKTKVESTTHAHEAYLLGVEWEDQGLRHTAGFRFDGPIASANLALSFLTECRNTPQAAGPPVVPAPSHGWSIIVCLLGAGIAAWIGSGIGKEDRAPAPKAVVPAVAPTPSATATTSTLPAGTYDATKVLGQSPDAVSNVLGHMTFEVPGGGRYDVGGTPGQGLAVSLRVMFEGKGRKARATQLAVLATGAGDARDVVLGYLSLPAPSSSGKLRLGQLSYSVAAHGADELSVSLDARQPREKSTGTIAKPAPNPERTAPVPPADSDDTLPPAFAPFKDKLLTPETDDGTVN